MENLDIYELFIDEDSDFSGIEAISIVENPAIEEDFIALKAAEVKLTEVNKERRILMGAALIPNKEIYRRNSEGEYYIKFSSETVGTWMVSVKVNNEEIWEEFVKTNRVKGFSIEGFFTDKLDTPKKEDAEELAAQKAIEIIKNLILKQ